MAVTALPPPRAVSFGARIADLAAQHGDATALVFAAADGHDDAVSWRALDTRANQVAHRFAGLLADDARPAAEVASERFVVLALPNSIDHVVGAIAAWRLGCCVLPLRADLPPWERDRLVALARPALVVADWPGADLSRADLAATRDAPCEPLSDRVADPAFAIASSGSTGRPKLIVTPGPGLHEPESSAYQTTNAMAAGRPQVQLVPAPLYHTNGFRLLHSTLHRGEVVVLMERFDAARAVELIERYGVTTVTMPPTMLLRIARLPGIGERHLDSLQSVLQGAASCPPWLVRWWIDRVGPERFFIAYGSTERVGLTMIRGDDWLRHPGSVGQGMRTDIRILDEAGNDVAPGVVGEIFLRSHDTTDDAAYQYVGAARVPTTADGFASVGDMGWLDDDGYLYLADRRTDMIVSGGANVFPAEVEAALLEHRAVADAVVVGVPDDEWGKRVHAVVELDPAQPAPSADELREHCRARLAPYKVPKAVTIVDALPRTDAGKLSRAAVLDQISS